VVLLAEDYGMFKTRYRVVIDYCAGYEAQFRRWWMPVWMPINYRNTSSSVEKAKAIIEGHKRGYVVYFE